MAQNRCGCSGATSGRQRSPSSGVERAEHRAVGQIAQDVAAALAPGVLEVQQLTAMLALEQLHARIVTPVVPRLLEDNQTSSAVPSSAETTDADRIPNFAALR